MAVLKQIARDKFAAEVTKAVNIAVPAIDRHLNNHIDGDLTTIYISELKLPRINKKVFGETVNKIIDIYRKSGWEVSFENDVDRDHSTLIFR